MKIQPIVSSQTLTVGENSRSLKYFAEVSPELAENPARRQDIRGIVRRSALPGGIQRLYEDAGYRIQKPTYVIFEDKPSARWPFFSAAADLALLSLLLAIAFVAMRIHLRKLSSPNSDGDETEANG